MEKLKNFLKNFQHSSTKTIGKEFAKYISNNRDMFDDYSVLEKKISSYNELYSQVKDFIRALDKSYKTIYNVRNTIYQVDYKLMEKFFKLRDELKKYGYYLEVGRKENGLNEDISGKWIEWKYKLVFLVVGKNMEIEFENIDDIRVEDYMGFWDRIKKRLGLG